MKLTIAQAAVAVGGVVAGPQAPEALITGAAADSRRVQAGDLYVAIAGERVDGHDFADQAVAQGAVAVMSTRPSAHPTIVVDDPVAALGRLASRHLEGLHATVVALTGSSGKTTTKDLIGDVLSGLGPTVSPAGSFNTEVGLPLTVIGAPEDTEYLVLEMGARGIGHVALLCGIAPPTIAVALNVGSAHLGEFGSRENIALAKSEIVQGPAVRTAILNADDPLVASMADVTKAEVIFFGESPTATIRATEVVLDGNACARYVLTTPTGSAPVALSLVGEHMVSNSLAAAAVAHAVGMPVGDIAEALGRATPKSRWRMEVTRRADGVTIVNDAYNANPESMRAALKALTGMKGEGRTWAVLGEMKELGEASVEEHDALGRLAVRLDISHVVAVGEGARPIHMGASHEGSWGDEAAWVPDVEAAVELLASQLRSGDVVLVKASRSVGLEKVADALLEAE